MTKPEHVWIAFGSNLGDRRANMRRALASLLEGGNRLLVASPLYSTSPVGYSDQGWYLNAVAQIETSLAPRKLLTRMQDIEIALGRERKRTIRNGPRTIDLDILLYGDQQVALPGLTIPHPRAHERLFVVAPWADAAPGLILPRANGLTLRQLRKQLTASEASEQAEFHADPPW